MVFSPVTLTDDLHRSRLNTDATESAERCRMSRSLPSRGSLYWRLTYSTVHGVVITIAS